MTNPLENIRKLWPTVVAVCAIFVAGATTMTLLIDMKSLPERMLTVEAVNTVQDRRLDSLSVASGEVTKAMNRYLVSIDSRLARMECNIELVVEGRRGVCQ